MVPSQGQPHLSASMRAPINVSGGLVMMDVHFSGIPPFFNSLHYFPSVPSPAFGMDSMPQTPKAVIPCHGSLEMTEDPSQISPCCWHPPSKLPSPRHFLGGNGTFLSCGSSPCPTGVRGFVRYYWGFVGVATNQSALLGLPSSPSLVKAKAALRGAGSSVEAQLSLSAGCWCRCSWRAAALRINKSKTHTPG